MEVGLAAQGKNVGGPRAECAGEKDELAKLGSRGGRCNSMHDNRLDDKKRGADKWSHLEAQPKKNRDKQNGVVSGRGREIRLVWEKRKGEKQK